MNVYHNIEETYKILNETYILEENNIYDIKQYGKIYKFKLF